jgi:hypothetical protein
VRVSRVSAAPRLERVAAAHPTVHPGSRAANGPRTSTHCDAVVQSAVGLGALSATTRCRAVRASASSASTAAPARSSVLRQHTTNRHQANVNIQDRAEDPPQLGRDDVRAPVDALASCCHYTGWREIGQATHDKSSPSECEHPESPASSASTAAPARSSVLTADGDSCDAARCSAASPALLAASVGKRGLSEMPILCGHRHRRRPTRSAVLHAIQRVISKITTAVLLKPA